MKLFVIVSRVPWPLEKGDKLRAYHHIRYLSQHFEIYLCCLSDSAVHPDALAALQPYCRRIEIFRLNAFQRGWNLFRGLFSKLPFQVSYFYSPRYFRKIKKLIDDIHPDHIFCQLVRVSEYVKTFDVPKTLDYQDVFSKGVERRIKGTGFPWKWILRSESKRLKKYEAYIFEYFDHTLIISEQDRNFLQFKEKEEVHILPNGVDIEYFNSSKAKDPQFDIVFTGNMGYPPNEDAAVFLVKEILPIVQKSLPDVHVLISGANPGNKVLSLVGDKVIVSGWVKDIRESYVSAKVFVAPMRIGTGMQNKLLEAMAMRLPCITTSLAATPLNAPADVLQVANTPEKIADTIIHLLTNKKEADELAEKACQFVRNNYSWDSINKHLLTVIQSEEKEHIRD